MICTRLSKSLATCALNRSHAHFFFDAIFETHEDFVFCHMSNDFGYRIDTKPHFVAG